MACEGGGPLRLLRQSFVPLSGTRSTAGYADIVRPAYPIPPVKVGQPNVCSICLESGPTLLGERDFGDNGNDFFSGERVFEPYGIGVCYYRCGACGFTFTNAFDDWSPQAFKDHVYNDDYPLTDPPFLEERPQRNAQMVAGLWHRAKGRSTVLDYGGGNGNFAAMLAHHGLDCETTDVFYCSQQPSQTDYGIVTCFEVIEHVPHAFQTEWFGGLSRYLAPQGTLLVSTEVLDSITTVNHYYIAPRNGHVSIHSPRSLRTLARKFDLDVYSINHEMHLLRPATAGWTPR